jgi:hypothetical protein
VAKTRVKWLETRKRNYLKQVSCKLYVDLKRAAIAVVLVSVLVAVSASACLTSTNNSTSSGGAVLAAEPTGGSWEPFVLNSSDEIRSLPPPSQGSPQFTNEVNELKALQLNRTAAVNESIDYWNNGSVVHWNAIACGLIQNYSLDELRAARTLANEHRDRGRWDLLVES